ncbi:4-hydroxybenzoate 3-monooxygenase [Propioniciclava flava]|uniref:4-hydroxybenzoate 3-monooxygenase n=1 Tax=Propioniciclava flava TaxID=2072026 RepID=A0A4Q2EL98_9ACTN|nr:4-hydroxybenzoate 3-monooxygenase [Propioniciclava flava]RXW33556.1 4-hydroxybenzoate 3-monooxygenase [Propioniciclava flava]
MPSTRSSSAPKKQQSGTSPFPRLDAERKTQVCIIGAGPAGLTVHQAMAQIGVTSVVIEARSRQYVQNRVRAGLVEPGTVRILDDLGVGQKLLRDAACHKGLLLQLDDTSARVPFGDITGEPVYMYPQQHIVRDLISASDPQRILFDTEAVNVETGSLDAAVTVNHAGRHFRVKCDFIVGADGAHGASRRSLPDERKKSYERDYGIDWLGILAETAPLADELIYSCSARGFALHSMRGESQSRLYLQVPRGSSPSWTDDRIWQELDYRLSPGAARIRRGDITERTAVKLKAFQLENPQYRRLFLIGDAAHTVPPSAAKGLNLAVEDAACLAQALWAWYQDHERGGLDRYASKAAQRAWLAQMFSAEMTRLLHVLPGDTQFDTKTRTARWQRIVDNPIALRDFADHYVGIARR